MIDSVGLGIYLLFALSYFLFIFALVVGFSVSPVFDSTHSSIFTL